ncbi:hypothetical protein [Salinibacter ruber]|uniref:Uncharacterized protein n=1 Tax=Salinibacter ruber TaxID=146919 RepID=A0AAW5P7L9_9BACT|nr:hypothetical protein [Salinibacter ruber]MCS4157628.1 hypothetical protein [Salinibacter ruber]
MPNPVEVNDDISFQKLKEDVQHMAEDANRRGEIGEANHNLHRVEAVRNPHGEPDFGGERAVIAQYDQGYRPGSNRGQLGSIQFYREERLPEMDETLLGERMEYASSPYVDKRQMNPSEKRPEENVHAANDIWSIDPELEDMGVDIDLLANDINRSRNVPKMDLDNKSQDGIDTVKTRKGELITDVQELRKEAGRILKQFPDYNSVGQPALKGMTPMELAEFVDEELEHYLSSHKVQETRAQKLWDQTYQLRRDAENIIHLGDETENVSQNAFRHTLKQPGFERPSGIGAGDAVEDYGVGSKEYLNLL